MTAGVRPPPDDPDHLDRADLVMVGDQDDALLSAVGAVAAARGARAVRTDRGAVARHLTVEFDGERATTSPRMPLLLRMESPASAATDRFAAAEAHAHVWAAAALMDAPVVNRPSSLRGSDWPPRLYIPLLLGTAGFDRKHLHDETYASTPPEPAGDYQTQALTPSGARSPVRHAVRYRHRRTMLAGHRRVVIAGEHHWVSPGGPEGDELARRSVEVASAIGLTLCSVTWVRAAGPGTMKLAKVTGHPHAAGLGELVGPVARALLDHLLR